MTPRGVRWWWLLAVALLCGMCVPASAHREIREWRSLGSPQCVSVNTQNGTVWAAIGSFVYHFTAEGAVLGRVRFVPDVGRAGQPTSVAVNPVDGSCWAFGEDGERGGVLVRYAADGREIWRQGGFGPPVGGAGWPPGLGVYPADGSCWVAYRTQAGSTWAGHLARLSPSGQVLYRRQDDGSTAIGPIAVNPSDGSCTAVVEGGPQHLEHLAADGSELWRSYPKSGSYYAVGVSPADGSIWLCDYSELVHLRADGHELWRRQPLHDAVTPVYGISVNPSDGSAWLGTLAPGLIHMSESGAVLWQEGADYHVAPTVCVDSRDGSAWAVRWDEEARLVHVAATGAMLREITGDYYPGWMAANPADGSCWVTDGTRAGGSSLDPSVARVSAAGATLWCGAPSSAFLTYAPVVVADSGDRSAWLIEEEFPQVTPGTVTSRLSHLSAAGAELWQTTVAEDPAGSARSLTEALDGSDGSVWVSCADPFARTSQLQRYAADGTLDWSASYPGYALAMSAAGDGSCWLIDRTARAAVRLARDGTTLAQYGRLGSLSGLAADPADGSCWVSSASTGGPPQYQVAHVAADGTELWRSLPITGTTDAVLSVDAATGFCWGADRADLFAYSAAGVELWRGPVRPWRLAVDSGDGSCWFSGATQIPWSERELVHLQIPLTPFGDVSYWHWARDEVNACAEAGIVQGYPSGVHVVYKPDVAVTRDQMAVYLARAFAGGEDAVPEPAEEPTFNDVGTDHWAYRYIEYCAQQDLVQGFDTGNYEPTLAVTRDQMAVYIARGLAGGEGNVPTGPAEATFPDVPNSGYGEDGTEPFWAYDHIEYCYLRGVVQGYDDGKYHPEYVLTRDQMAVFIARAYELPLEWATEW